MNNTTNINKTNNKTRRQRKKSNKTMKQANTNTPKIVNSNNAKYYTKYYTNTHLLPFSSIINYINNNYDSFNNLSSNSNTDTIINSFSFYFNVNNDFLNENKSDAIDTPIQKNAQMDLNKLLAYALYIKSKRFFQLNNKLNIEDLKYQIGKDVSRIDIFINGDLYKNPYIEEDTEQLITNFQKADHFNLTLVDYFNDFSKKIDYNQINQLGIACCQNLFNLVTDQINLALMYAIQPEICVFLNGNKHIEITINETARLCKLFFSCNLVISYKQILDPEYTCGNLDFILTLDFVKNTYYYESFVLNYNVNNCDPYVYEANQNLIQELDQKKNSSKLKYVIPAAAVTGAVVATPFLLGVLGGKGKDKGNRNGKKNSKKNSKK
jgi:hypothetical protein